MGVFFENTHEAYKYVENNYTPVQIKRMIQKYSLQKETYLPYQEDDKIGWTKKIISKTLEGEKWVLAYCDHYRGNSGTMVCTESYAKSKPHVDYADRGVISYEPANAGDFKKYFVYLN